MSRDYYLCFIDRRGITSQRTSRVFVVTQVLGGGGEAAQTGQVRPTAHARLFPWVGIVQALIFTQGGLSTQPDLPAGWPVFVSWVFTGHRLSCLPQRTTAPRRGRSQAGVQLVPPCLRFLRMKAWALLLRVVSRAWRHLACGVKD